MKHLKNSLSRMAIVSLAMLFSFTLSSCGDDDDDNNGGGNNGGNTGGGSQTTEYVATGAATSISETSATLNGTWKATAELQSDTEVGFAYSTTKTPSTGGTKVQATTKNGTAFSASVTGLSTSTAYYYCAYAKVDGKYYYGSVQTFTTTTFEVKVTTGDASDIASTGATLSATVDTKASIAECGFQYATTADVSKGSEAKGTKSGNNFTAKISGLTAATTYYYRAYVKVGSNNYYGETKSFTTKGAHEYVDLGLSVLWATCNVGADKPEDYGGYYAWGETITKNDYSWRMYYMSDDTGETFNKYNTDSHYGTVDNKTTLEPISDVAHVKWGGSWRMPTDTECNELRNGCTWTWTTQNGVDGYKVTSKTNGNSIFLPAAGFYSGTTLYYKGKWGCFWSSSLNTEKPNEAYQLYCQKTNYSSWNVNGSYRCQGNSVRPVHPK